ncbi:MAG: helix-turn-helix transcriptional regulator [Hormoscilla sp. GM7CHS1pb]|nr:helix-turn-helix transcriptional regulator [Hormoscilla sp. GM7CHS1pb]
MKVKTQLAQLRASRGNVSYEKIAASTGIDSQQLRELEIGEAQAIALTTLGKLCTFFQCTPNDLFARASRNTSALASMERRALVGRGNRYNSS